MFCWKCGKELYGWIKYQEHKCNTSFLFIENDTQMSSKKKSIL